VGPGTQSSRPVPPHPPLPNKQQRYAYILAQATSPQILPPPPLTLTDLAFECGRKRCHIQFAGKVCVMPLPPLHLPCTALQCHLAAPRLEPSKPFVPSMPRWWIFLRVNARLRINLGTSLWMNLHLRYQLVYAEIPICSGRAGPPPRAG